MILGGLLVVAALVQRAVDAAAKERLQRLRVAGAELVVLVREADLRNRPADAVERERQPVTITTTTTTIIIITTTTIITIITTTIIITITIPVSMGGRV